MPRALIHADGASSGNPGPAGIGAVVEIEGRDAIELHAHIGHATNNVAEYSALIHALRCALQHGAQDLDIKLDSELLVKQIKGEYKVRHVDMKPLYAEAMGLLQQARKFKISHVPRELNKRADALSKMGVEDGTKPKHIAHSPHSAHEPEKVVAPVAQYVPDAEIAPKHAVKGKGPVGPEKKPKQNTLF